VSLERWQRFKYEADYNEQLVEYELDTVLGAEYEGDFKINEEEAKAARWVRWKDLVGEMEDYPERFTPWFGLIVGDERVQKYLEAGILAYNTQGGV
jgi:isopentenyl-diphosphate Delta-isomerase